jgi:hypothetical protein
MNKLRDAADAIARYERTHRHPDRPALAVSPRYSLFPELAEPGPRWPDSWPNAGNRGVYLMLDAEESVLYVGKASVNSSLGARLGAYFQYGDDRRCKFRFQDYWLPLIPTYVVTIAVPDDSPFEAPALEEFLIRELGPPRNTVGGPARRR